jgi:hypothetical protein
MQPIVYIIWRIYSLWTAIVRSTGKTAVRLMLRGEVTDGTDGRQAAPTGCRHPYADCRLPFMKYAPYTVCHGIRRGPRII